MKKVALIALLSSASLLGMSADLTLQRQPKDLIMINNKSQNRVTVIAVWANRPGMPPTPQIEMVGSKESVFIPRLRNKNIHKQLKSIRIQQDSNPKGTLYSEEDLKTISSITITADGTIKSFNKGSV